VGFVEPNHEHGDAYDERDGEVDPKEVIDERGVDETTLDGCLVVSEGSTLNGLWY